MSAPSEQPRSKSAAILACIVGLVAGGTGVIGAIGMWMAPSVPETAGAIGLHVLAAVLARFAARIGGAMACETDLVLVLALVAPLFGPALAWSLIFRGAPGKTQNAHAAFEEEQAAAHRDLSPELERELLVRSHAQVLRHGSLEEKRNLLRQLTRIGERRYLLLLRRFLRDPEPELRLCAYAEIARESQQREERIGRLRLEVAAIDPAEATARAAAIAELAEANRDYGTSGLVDEAMGEYWLEQACRIAQDAIDVDASCRAAQCAWALAKAELGDVELGWNVVSAWPEDVEPEHDLARAELAFRRRDRGTCMAVADRFTLRGIEMPVWLRETVGVHDANVHGGPAYPEPAWGPTDAAFACEVQGES